MSEEDAVRFRVLEGRRVSLALRDGTRIDDCELMAIGRYGLTELWVYANGFDRFVKLTDVVDIWESASTPGTAAIWR